MDDPQIEIAYATNEEYLPVLGTSLHSLIEHTASPRKPWNVPEYPKADLWWREARHAGFAHDVAAWMRKKEVAPISSHRNVMAAEALVTKKRMNLVQLVAWLEHGAENVYLVDDAGRYCWNAARKASQPILYDKYGYALAMTPMEPIIFDDPIDDAHLQPLMAIGEAVFARHPEERELPIVSSEGKIRCVARTEVDEKPLGWQEFTADEVRKFLPDGKIYVSSLKNKRIAEFCKQFQDAFLFEALSASNSQDIFAGDKGILLYDTDLFPACRKMSIRALYQNLVKMYQPARLSECVRIFHDWAILS